MPKARVFISHSTKEALTPAEAAAREVLEALTRALQADDRFHVLLDRLQADPENNSRILPGDAWRARINLWVGACDAAVILVSQAALDSPYVAYETSILSYRRAFDRSLRVIPVLVPPVTPETLKGSRLGPHQLGELQVVQGGSTDLVVERVLKALRDARYFESPVERRAGHLADVLEEADDRDVIAASEALGLDPGPWLPQATPAEDRHRRLRLAVQLLSVGMGGATQALLLLRKRMRDAAAVDRMIDLVASSWVDYRSTTRIPLVVRDHAGPRTLGVNASNTDTASLYMVCAASNDAVSHANGVVDSWFVAPVNGAAGEKTLDDLEAEIRGSLEYALNVAPDRLDGDLKDLFTWKPVLVVLAQSAGLKVEMLPELHERIKHVTFFLLTGGQEGASALRDSPVEFLIPELGEDDEDAILNAYRSLKVVVRTEPRRR
jgi:hypothetical protein